MSMQSTRDLPETRLPDTKGAVTRLVPGPFDLCFAANSQSSRFASSLNRNWMEMVAHSLSLLLILLVMVFILSSPGVSQSAPRPETGTYIRDTQRDGYGLLTIHNNWTMDTVAVLTDQNVKPMLVVYLRSKESLNITGIKDGDYSLYFTIGDRWDGSAGRFSSVYGYYRYNAPLPFVTDDSGDKIEYSIYELDLYEAGASNFLPDQFTFPDISSSGTALISE